MIQTLQEQFLAKKYVKVEKIIGQEALDLITNYLSIQTKRKYFLTDGFSSSAKYGDLVMEALLVMIRLKIEEITGKSLIPTYSYVRIYKNGDDLVSHIDRPACEYSATLTLYHGEDELWPIHVIDEGKKVDICLDKGDLLLYKGCDLVHGRDKFKGKFWIQVFLHYVDKDGELKEWKYDKREKLGDPGIILPK